MKVKYIILIFLSIIIISIGLFIVKYNENDIVVDVNNNLLIGLSFDSLVVERWKRDMETFVSYANEKGMDVIVQVANDDVDEQISQIEYLVDQNVDVLVILPKDAIKLNSAIEKAKKKGIKVISYDRLILNTSIDLYISFDNIGIGESIANSVISSMAKVNREEYNLLIINGDPNDNNSKMLNEGYYNIIESTDININIIDEVWANQWREQYANDSVDEILANNQRIDGIICSNDLLAQSAIRVLSEYKLADEIPVASQDAELSACQRIVEGTQLASVYKPINNLAKTTIDMIPIILSQKSIENVDYIDNGSNLTVYKKLDFELVTKENIEEIIIESGFHSKEDVYRYVGNQD